MRYFKVFILILSVSILAEQDAYSPNKLERHVAYLEKVVTSHSKTLQTLEDTIKKLARQVAVLSAKLDREDSRRAAKQNSGKYKKQADDSNFKSQHEGRVVLHEDRSTYNQAETNLSEEK